ncbi:PadR family transcriptional regulator [Clostridium estertheticum]|uniref:PadR family transcriptional regulator n=1 Tax=Clostridium estertheticum TaxID=238834 RepID=UPI001C7DC643|nr:PadR family transcriptional regulator [Clostridium estertheticum]MBX4263118.1 PadR family transcriptional regulator [Clostridium estertheticum]WLC89431.1 PadR family transcriptional regulator [Clostridium estertheticum]
MRTLKYAILGLINRKPITGYDIGKEFNFQLAEFWSAKLSQIYPELKKLVDENLIVYDIEISGDVLEKKIYDITEKGKNEFLKWLKKDVPMEQTPKNIFRLRMYFSSNLDVNTRIDLLEHQLLKHNERLTFLHEQKEPYDSVPPLNSDVFGDYLVLDGAIIREESTIKWLENCINYCKNGNEV